MIGWKKKYKQRYFFIISVLYIYSMNVKTQNDTIHDKLIQII